MSDNERAACATSREQRVRHRESSVCDIERAACATSREQRERHFMMRKCMLHIENWNLTTNFIFSTTLSQ